MERGTEITTSLEIDSIDQDLVRLEEFVLYIDSNSFLFCFKDLITTICPYRAATNISPELLVDILLISLFKLRIISPFRVLRFQATIDPSLCPVINKLTE